MSPRVGSKVNPGTAKHPYEEVQDYLTSKRSEGGDLHRLMAVSERAGQFQSRSESMEGRMKKKSVVVGCVLLAFVVVVIAPFALVWAADQYRFARLQKLIEAEPPASRLPAPIDES